MTMLTSEDWEMIAVDLLVGREPRVLGPDADEARERLKKEIEYAEAQGWEIELPFEIMREDL